MPWNSDKYWALKDISFKVYHGETLGVLGRNGAGKSTLLRLLAGIISPDRGNITYMHGFRASLLSLQVGFSGHLTGRQNIVMSGMLLGVSRPKMLECTPEIIAFSGLGEFIDQPVRTYSSGMRARLGFAISYYANPDALLIDEVLGVGDADFKKKTSALMKERIKSDKTVVLVSHNKATIKKYCDRAVLIDNGVVSGVGETAEVVRQYNAQQR